MKYESVVAEDLSRCARVFVEVFNSAPWNERWSDSSAELRLTEIFNTPGFHGLKALVDGKVIAFAMGYIESFDDGKDFYLKEMCVVPGEQRRGVGAALLEELEKTLLAAGVRKIYLLTSCKGPAAEFYSKAGFYTSEKMIMMGRWLKPRSEDN